MKSTLRASLLKGSCGSARMRLAETPSGRCLMGAHAYSLDRGMVMPRHPPLSIRRNTVPLRGLVTPVYLYWYPVLSLRDRLNAACGQPLNSVVFLVILGPSLVITVHMSSFFPFFPEMTEFYGNYCLFGPWGFFLLGGGRSSSSLDLAVLSLCLLGTQRLAPLDSPEGPGRGSPGSGNGNWLISSCATRFNTVALCLAAFVCFWYWERVRACLAWSLRICLTSRELSAKDGEGGPLGTLADIASSVHGVLVRRGDGGALGALSDSVESLLLEELPLVSLEAGSDVSSVPMVDEESGLLSDVPLVSAALLSVAGPVSGTLSLFSSRCSVVSGLGMASAAGVIGSKGSAAGGGLCSCGVSHSLNGMYLVSSTGLSLKVTTLSDGASETKSTAVSCSELGGGPERTEFS